MFIVAWTALVRPQRPHDAPFKNYEYCRPATPKVAPVREPPNGRRGLVFTTSVPAEDSREESIFQGCVQ